MSIAAAAQQAGVIPGAPTAPDGFFQNAVSSVASGATPISTGTLGMTANAPLNWPSIGVNAVNNAAAAGGSFDPNAGTAGYGTGTAGNSNASYYDSLTNNANSQLGRLDTQAGIGNQNIQDAYNTSYNQLLGQKGIAQRNYDNTKAQTLQDTVTARGNIQAGVGQTENSLQRLLGAHGAGNSSAAQFAAPYAAARTGSLQNNQVQQAYDRNQQSLDTNYGDYTNHFNTSLGELGHQRDTQTNALQSRIDSNRQGLLSQLSQIAQARTGSPAAGNQYQSQISDLGNQIDQLGKQYANPVVQAPTPAYQAPTLQSYNYTQAPAAQINGEPGASSNLNPFLSVLLGAQDKNKNGGF